MAEILTAVNICHCKLYRFCNIPRPSFVRQLFRIELALLVIILSSVVDCKKKEILKPSRYLLEKELNRLTQESIKCTLNSITYNSLEDLRIRNQNSKAIACHIQYLGSHQEDGWAWSSLGEIYFHQGAAKSSSMSANCFKQALKLTGKMSPFIRQWHFVGPFVIGKMEVDGDPIEAYGGIQNISRKRFQKKSNKFLSETMPNGETAWSIQKQKSGTEMIKIAPQVNWNDLVNSLGSTAITEWQGWVVGEFSVNENNQNIVIQCLGVHTVFVDNIPITGDVYRREQFWFSVLLKRGIHTIYARLRAKGVQMFQCTIDIASSSFEVLNPHYLPDLYDGYLFSTYIALPISNHHTSKWLKNIKVTVDRNSDGHPFKVVHSEDKNFGIAPGQVRAITLQLSSESNPILEVCNDIDLQIKLKVSTSEGQLTFPIKLRCRKKHESFLFTFLDHDGSVQHGAAVHPIMECEKGVCPVVLSQHGTTVPPQNQADSYKRMVNGDFVFGLDTAWLVAPTRHGAHNWEGPGALTALAALEALAALVDGTDWISQKASTSHVIFAGHSMGGHGAWHLATHYPDRALAVISLAGWLRKEEYGDSNLFFRHDIALSHIDPAVKAVMEACIAENEADRLVSNLADVPVLLRIGANDRTIHPWFVRRMYRLLREWNINATYVELPNKEHWWWDTWETNDGGAVNDKQIRDFTSRHSTIPSSDAISCDAEKHCDEAADTDRLRYSPTSQGDSSFTYTVVNPAFGESMKGIHVLQQLAPFRVSKVQCNIGAEIIDIHTTNVARMKITEPLFRTVGWADRTIKVDNMFSFNLEISKGKVLCLLHNQGMWIEDDSCDTYITSGERGPVNLGPARRVAEYKFLIVIGTQTSEDHTQKLQEFGVYIANLFYLTDDGLALVVRDKDLTHDTADNYNLIVIGNAAENSFTQHYLDQVPLHHNTDGFKLGQCGFSERQTGALFLAPHGNQRLALVLMASSLEGLRDVVSLATPTIPPMTRSPFSNLIPDYVITGPEFRGKGAGGYLCAGFWGNHWEYRSDLASCAYC